MDILITVWNLLPASAVTGLVVAAPFLLWQLVAVAVSSIARVSQRDEISRAAGELGLPARYGLLGSVTIRGKRGGLPVELTAQDKGTVTLRVGNPEMPKSLHVASAKLLPADGRVRTGDGTFDALVSFRAPAGLGTALLDETTRDLIRRAVKGNVTIEFGVIRLVEPHVQEANPILSALGRVDEFVEVAKRLAISEFDVPDRLAHNAAHESRVEVRLNNLLVLAMEFPTHRRCLEAHRQALTSDVVLIRLAAVRFLAGSATSRVDLPVTAPEVKVLLDLAQSDEQQNSVRLEAIQSLGRPIWRQVAGPLCLDLLKSPSQAFRLAAFDALMASQYEIAIPDLISLLEDATGLLACRLVAALGDLAGKDGSERHIPKVQSCLLELLSPDVPSREDRELTLIVAEVLGRIGDRECVAPLLEKTGLFVAVDRAVQDAVRRIQARIVGGEAGQLSLVDAGDSLAGSLSRAAETAGVGALSSSSTAVSVSPEDGPQT